MKAREDGLSRRNDDWHKDGREVDTLMTDSEYHELAVKRLLGQASDEWSEREAVWHARQFIKKNRRNNDVRRLAEKYLESLGLTWHG